MSWKVFLLYGDKFVALCTNRDNATLLINVIKVQYHSVINAFSRLGQWTFVHCCYSDKSVGVMVTEHLCDSGQVILYQYSLWCTSTQSVYLNQLSMIKHILHTLKQTGNWLLQGMHGLFWNLTWPIRILFFASAHWIISVSEQ